MIIVDGRSATETSFHSGEMVPAAAHHTKHPRLLRQCEADVVRPRKAEVSLRLPCEPSDLCWHRWPPDLLHSAIRCHPVPLPRTTLIRGADGVKWRARTARCML